MCLGDMLSGGVNSASVASVCCAWITFRELSGISTKKDVSLKLKGKVYATRVRSAMVYWSETMAINAEHVGWFEWTEMKMLQWMYLVSPRHNVLNVEMRERVRIELVTEVVKNNQLIEEGGTCVTERWWWLGEEKHVVWGGQRDR